ncbi:MAG TPA: nickel pincer cofactor biosynthesis protein LarB [Methylomirabilota bacterium]|jgi:NCAIR mutase (PurE)-related protein|nr:nickel pincer cofactor biosynthesis protein LarB [Methylomirabilota bacterium]
MDRARLQELLGGVQRGAVTIEQALEALKTLPFENLDFARIDHHRALRKGFPEVILGQGKTARQVVAIAQRLIAQGQCVLVTRLDEQKAEEVRVALPAFRYYHDGRLGALGEPPIPPTEQGTILVVSAGTADVPVAEEAAVTAEFMGNRVERLYDVGVAGLHRLLDNINMLHAASVLIVVAGMEGALPSVIGGLVDRPVIAVPTSIGYGASFNGLAALLAMLNSCAAGITVVNIDNGFGAAAAATLMNRVRR